jgi:DNA replication protein DnaC
MTRTTSCRHCGAEIEYEPSPLDSAAGFCPQICTECAANVNAEEAEQARTEARLERNVPLRYAGATFESFKARTPTQRRALEAARDHAREGVFLLGPPGCGKTHLACAAVMDGPAGSLFVSTTDLLDDIRAGFDNDGRGLFERAKRSPLLALDDLGSEAVKDWVRDRLYTLLNARWNDGLPIITTTNCSPQTIGERIGKAGVSRLAGLCRHRIDVQGPDGRRELQEAS